MCNVGVRKSLGFLTYLGVSGPLNLAELLYDLLEAPLGLRVSGPAPTRPDLCPIQRIIIIQLIALSFNSSVLKAIIQF